MREPVALDGQTAQTSHTHLHKPLNYLDPSCSQPLLSQYPHSPSQRCQRQRANCTSSVALDLPFVCHSLTASQRAPETSLARIPNPPSVRLQTVNWLKSVRLRAIRARFTTPSRPLRPKRYDHSPKLPYPDSPLFSLLPSLEPYFQAAEKKLKAILADEKFVSIALMLADGRTSPRPVRITWSQPQS